MLEPDDLHSQRVSFRMSQFRIALMILCNTIKWERNVNQRVAPVLRGVIGGGLKALDFPCIGTQRLATRNWRPNEAGN